MFTLNEPILYSIKKALKLSLDEGEALLEKYMSSKKTFEYKTRIYRESLSALFNSVSKLDEGSPLKKQVNTNRDILKVYPTEDIRHSDFYRMSYLQAKEHLADLEQQKVFAKENLQIQRKLYEECLRDLDLSQKISNSIYVEDTPIECKADTTGTFIDVHNLMPTDYIDLQEMRCNIYMILRNTKIFPANHKQFPSYKKIQEQLYFYIVKDESQEGRWYHDVVGKGNIDDFKVVNRDKPFRDVHKSRADYLSEMYFHFLENDNS